MKTELLLLMIGSLLFFFIVFQRSRLPGMIQEAFDNAVPPTFASITNAQAVTKAGVAPLCPPTFKFYTDRDGVSMCCRGRIDFTEGRCYPGNDKSTLPHVCTLGAKMKDEYGDPVNFCGSMIQSLLSELGAQDCTTGKPKRATADGISGFCCSDAPSPATPDQCPAGAASCVVLKPEESPFERSNSCGLERLTDGAFCPAGMNKTMMVGKDGEIINLTVPLCMSITSPLSKTVPMCIPRTVLNALRRYNKYQQKDFNKWIGNCDVYDKVNIAQSLPADPKRVDLSGF
jgi:hypothetical protein